MTDEDHPLVAFGASANNKAALRQASAADYPLRWFGERNPECWINCDHPPADLRRTKITQANAFLK
ncbi:hypothetical protein ACPOL_6818 (plasmid) [Acidisarcina polymorpha]|uniref:Uncharacterized protein n=1 Tax=Acidisarcina polymorpha TaxID=2211140 RepID=A0A2Z5GAK2_9BACT|nr:hypothetical protein [Acidisarcina polymorpha]AXC16028.1 hypothetical protein ACPOL_6818 [Acidisarcina polymorpha]